MNPSRHDSTCLPCPAGLDYALLEKVRAEISTKEREEEQQMEDMVDAQGAPEAKEKKEDPEEHIQVGGWWGRDWGHKLVCN